MTYHLKSLISCEEARNAHYLSFPRTRTLREAGNRRHCRSRAAILAAPVLRDQSAGSSISLYSLRLSTADAPQASA